MNPLVTVVTSTFNWPNALVQAIPTVLSQTFEEFEYLIIGDCCTDETEEVVRAFGDPRIRWHNLKVNTGNQSGVNKKALALARGEYIAYLNHDDLWLPNHLDSLLKPMKEYDLDVSNTLCIEIGAAGHHYRGLLGLPTQVSQGIFSLQPMTTCVMHTAKAAREAGGWTDWRETHSVPTQDFFHRLRELRNRFAVVTEVTALKFHSGDRKSSYLLRDASEQEYWAERIRLDPGFLMNEIMTAIACKSMDERPPKLNAASRPSDAPKGWQVEQWRRMRGLKPMLDLPEESFTDFQINAPRPSLIRPRSDGKALISPMFITTNKH